MKKCLTFLLVFCANILLSQINFDTLESRKIVDGVWYKKLNAPSVPLKLYMLKIDLTSPKLRIKTAKAMNMVKQFKDQITLLGPVPAEQLSTILMNNTTSAYTIVAGINGDFSTEEGRPYNIQVIDQQILQKPNNSTVLSFDKNKNPYMGKINFTGSVIVKTKFTQMDSVVNIDGVNSFRLSDQLCLYNQYIGSEQWPDSLPRSGQNQWGPEMIIDPVSGWKVNDTMLCLIKKITPLNLPPVNTRFPIGSAVLSQHRNNDDWLAKALNTGDTIKLFFGLKPPQGTGLANPVEMIGGSPQIVKNGVQRVDQAYIDEGITIDPTKPHHSKEFHPRSVAGLSADKKYLYLITIDGGNNQVSKGMTLYQLGDLLVNFGIPDVLNLNGGEAATMFVQDQVVNQPSTGAEIPIGNCLYVEFDPSTEVNESKHLPSGHELYQNYPNPFNPSTFISFDLPKSEHLTLKVYNLLGNEVATLFNGRKEAGYHKIEFNPSEMNLSSGIYFYRLIAGNFRSSRKMLYIK